MKILKRLIKETPKFWRAVQIFGVLLGLIATGLLTADLELTEDTQDLMKYLITIGGTLAGIGQFAVTDNEEAGPQED